MEHQKGPGLLSLYRDKTWAEQLFWVFWAGSVLWEEAVLTLPGSYKEGQGGSEEWTPVEASRARQGILQDWFCISHTSPDEAAFPPSTQLAAQNTDLRSDSSSLPKVPSSFMDREDSKSRWNFYPARQSHSNSNWKIFLKFIPGLTMAPAGFSELIWRVFPTFLKMLSLFPQMPSAESDFRRSTWESGHFSWHRALFRMQTLLRCQLQVPNVMFTEEGREGPQKLLGPLMEWGSGARGDTHTNCPETEQEEELSGCQALKRLWFGDYWLLTFQNSCSAGRKRPQLEIRVDEKLNIQADIL